MSVVQSRLKFFETEAGQEIERELERMTLDEAFNTEDSYTPDTAQHPDNRMSFMDKHKSYLIAHPAIDPVSYVANLRLKTRLR